MQTRFFETRASRGKSINQTYKGLNLRAKFRLFSLTFILLSYGLVSFTSAQDIAYTVQVIALSDEVRALQMQSDLAAQGHPAYLLTVPAEQGTVYRLRVGAFANREAAAHYAEGMPSLGDSDPSPALAESIPQHLIPLLPELIQRLPVAESSLSVTTWQDTFALKSANPQTFEEATYTVIDGPTFTAWRAFPQADGSIIRVHSLSLWPEAYEVASDAERSAFTETVISEVAAQLGLSTEQVSSFTFDAEPPFLVMVEQFDPKTGERKWLPALGQPLSDLGANGPDLQWFGEAPTLNAPDVLFESGSENVSQPLVLSEGWRAVADSDYTRLESLDGQKSWRAVAGRPLWAGANVLVTQAGQDVLVYRFLTR